MGSSLGGEDPVFNGNAGLKLPQHTKGVLLGIEAMYLYSLVLFVLDGRLYLLIANFGPINKKKKKTQLDSIDCS